MEDIFAGLAGFVSGGAVGDIQDIVRQFNTILPADTRETSRVAADLGADLTDLGAHLHSVDTLLEGLDTLTRDAILTNMTAFDQLLTPYGVQHTTDGVNAAIGVIYLLTALEPIADNAIWTAPLLVSADRTTRAVVPMLFGRTPSTPRPAPT
ncbi:hypothetical protein [Nocardia bovistercoris]|uniref:Mce family protein n=1 Tax=Nocardia bovistercoris TaxID=2785916 RepID=A0A931N6D9_9NOCA|nr:hypothetical protein [Nocardia bovistercoris]MBH0780652.1 hypothetical protein [Nocardia bovistercoris]